MRALLQGYKKLASVRVRAFVRHGDYARLGVSSHEVLVGKVRGFVDRARARAVLFVGEVAALEHEPIDDPVKVG